MISTCTSCSQVLNFHYFPINSIWTMDLPPSSINHFNICMCVCVRERERVIARAHRELLLECVQFFICFDEKSR
jgi:hypothetical protein